MKVRIKKPAAVKTEKVTKVLVTATVDKVTKNQIRYRIDENTNDLSGSVYVPKELKSPEKIKMLIVLE